MTRQLSLWFAAAALCALAMGAHAQSIRRAPAFAPADLVAAPKTDWATNGGDLSNRRWSPLTAINRDNVATLKGDGAPCRLASCCPAWALRPARPLWPCA